MLFYMLDLVGTFAFAYYGAVKGLSHELDSLGITVCAALTALGGGTIRELILNTSPYYLHDYNYLYAVIAGSALAMICYRMRPRLHSYMGVIDAVGLSIFAYIGAARADDASLGIAAMGLFAMLTATGGGILADVITRVKPVVFRGGFYAIPALCGGIAYYLLQPYMSKPLAVYGVISAIFAMRLTAVWWKPVRLQLRKKGWRAKLTWSFFTSSVR